MNYKKAFITVPIVLPIWVDNDIKCHSIDFRYATHPPKIKKIVKGDHPNGGVICKGVGKVAISDQYLAIARKRLH